MGGADLSIIMYSVISEKTLDNCFTKWYDIAIKNHLKNIEHITQNTKKKTKKKKTKHKIILIGNKIDLRENEQIMERLKQRNQKVLELNETRKLLKKRKKKFHFDLFFETSLLYPQNENDNLLIHDIIVELIGSNKIKNK